MKKLVIARHCLPVWSKFFKAVCDPHRQEILSLIHRHHQRNVTQLVEALGLSQPTVSHHLRILVDADVLTMEKQGKESIFSISQTHIKECCSGFMAMFTH